MILWRENKAHFKYMGPIIQHLEEIDEDIIYRTKVGWLLKWREISIFLCDYRESLLSKLIFCKMCYNLQGQPCFKIF